MNGNTYGKNMVKGTELSPQRGEKKSAKITEKMGSKVRGKSKQSGN